MVVSVPRTIVELVAARRLLFSAKAQRQLDTGRYSLEDLLHSILYGKIHKKERDELKEARDKYTIIGPSVGGPAVYSCGKIVTREGKRYLILTFHAAR
jgi:hypothetical protein